MIRIRALSLALIAALLLAGLGAAWHGADHASLEAHQELCAVCSLGAQLESGLDASPLPYSVALILAAVPVIADLVLSGSPVGDPRARAPPASLA